MGKTLERFGEVGIVDETNGFELDFVKQTVGLSERHPRRKSSTIKKDRFGTCIILGENVRKTRGF